MKNEALFRRAMVVAIKNTHNIAQPIESGTTGLGVPDLFVRTSKVSAWIELKNYQYPLRYPFEISFRPGQAMWLERHYKLGGVSILGVSTVEGNYFFANESIKRIYDSDMADWCDYYCSNIIGKDFIRWLDNL